MKKITAFTLLVTILMGTPVFALSDSYIISDIPRGIYAGTLDSDEITANVRFTDIADGFWAKTPIIRDAALNLVKGYDRRFSPQANMTNEEAITFIIRAIGRESEAVALSAQLQAAAPSNSSLSTVWSLGHLNIASTLGIITPAEYADAVTQTDAVGNLGSTFLRLGPAKRENVAHWLVTAMRSVNPAAFPDETTIQKIFSYSDYNSISAAAGQSVELLAINGIMGGYPDGSYRPKGSLTRAEMAQILYNLDDIYFKTMGLEKRTGTVGALRDNQLTDTGGSAALRNVYVRSSDGSVDVLQTERYASANTPAAEALNRDAVTLRNQTLGGMSLLEEGDTIEYIVRPADNRVLYVQAKGTEKEEPPVPETTVTGKLYSVDPASGGITILDSAGKYFIYYAAKGIFTVSGGGNFIKLDKQDIDVTRLPYGSSVSLKLKNNTVIEITYIGEQKLVDEIRGVVIENNADFGYIAVIDNSGKPVTKYYYENDLTVEKQQHYDEMDEIGYIDSVFPDFRYDPRDTTISEIEPGDIVFMRISKGDGSIIESISASTNYTAKYGKITAVTPSAENPGESFEIMVEYENKQTAWFTVAGDIFVSKQAKPVSVEAVAVGDWVKLLVNQAVIQPGYMLETVKEIAVEGSGHLITSIVMGNFAGVNAVQMQIMVENSYTLAKTGWTDYKNLSTYSISGSDVEWYQDGKRISLDFAQRYLKHSGATVYLAFEGGYSGERLKKITFRTQRDEVLPADTVLSSNGSGEFTIMGANGPIKADSGTIVRRHGRLADGKDVMALDYTNVVLNGAGVAAVVDILDAQDTSKLMIARGRIYSIDDGKSFKVQSMSVLSGVSWVYTPVQREFTIDHNTLFFDASGFVNRDTFIGYGDQTKIDRVFYIVTEGSRATHVVDASYATRSVRGTVYKTDAARIYLKDASYYVESTGQWLPVSNSNAVLQILTAPNTIIAKNNAVVQQSALVTGDVIRVMASSMPDKPQSNAEIAGNIIIVEK